MTITRQIIFVYILSLLLLFMGAFFTTMLHIRGYYEDQLNNNAQDSATALGLTLSKNFSSTQTNADSLSHVKAIFDQGYFSSIKVKDIHDNVLVQRHITQDSSAAPGWFQSLVSINNVEHKALIMKGWKQVGTVWVKSNDNLAYRSLWSTTVNLFLLFFFWTLVLSFLGVLMIKKLLKPLKDIIQQAKDIGDNKLYLLINIPRTYELRILSETMNAMVAKLHKIFAEQLAQAEALREKIYVDNLTKIGNRRYFFHHMEDFLGNEDKFLPGYLVLIELDGLLEFNQKQGYSAGDKVLQDFTASMKNCLEAYPSLLFSRLDGPHFAFVLNVKDDAECNEILEVLYTEGNKVLDSLANELKLCIAAATYQFDMPISKVLEMTDRHLAIARDKPAPCIDVQAPEVRQNRLKFANSQKHLKEAIKNNQFCFYTQPVRSDISDFHKEVYVKLLSPEGNVSASNFLPLARQIGLDHKIDEYLLQQLSRHSLKTDVFAINLSHSAIYNNKCQKSLFNILDKNCLNPKNIQFEISENILVQDVETSTKLLHKLQKLGYKTGIDQVGATLLSLSHFNDYGIHYLKLDPAITKKLEHDEYKRKIIQNFVRICDNMGIYIIATQIESQQQYQALKDLNIQWFQGNYIP